MKQMPANYSIVLGEIIVYCDNNNAINISKNSCHFVRDLVKTKIVVLKFVKIDKQLADIFTKPLNFTKLDSLRKSLGICSF